MVLKKIVVGSLSEDWFPYLEVTEPTYCEDYAKPCTYYKTQRLLVYIVHRQVPFPNGPAKHNSRVESYSSKHNWLEEVVNYVKGLVFDFQTGWGIHLYGITALRLRAGTGVGVDNHKLYIIEFLDYRHAGCCACGWTREWPLLYGACAWVQWRRALCKCASTSLTRQTSSASTGQTCTPHSLVSSNLNVISLILCTAVFQDLATHIKKRK